MARRKTPDALTEALIPSAYRDENNNPIWNMAMITPVHRQDNSMSMSVHLGALSNDELHANVSQILGGFVFGLDIQRRRKGKRVGDITRYAINCRPILEKVIELHEEFQKTPRRPNVRKSNEAARPSGGSAKKNGRTPKRP